MAPPIKLINFSVLMKELEDKANITESLAASSGTPTELMQYWRLYFFVK
jgi:hypothetical protein